MQDLVIDETKLDDYVLIVKDWCLVNGTFSNYINCCQIIKIIKVI